MASSLDRACGSVTCGFHGRRVTLGRCLVAHFFPLSMMPRRCAKPMMTFLLAAPHISAISFVVMLRPTHSSMKVRRPCSLMVFQRTGSVLSVVFRICSTRFSFCTIFTESEHTAITAFAQIQTLLQAILLSPWRKGGLSLQSQEARVPAKALRA